MSKIKVIKRNDILKQNRQVEREEENSPPTSTERGSAETIEDWIADWRQQTEIKSARALGELTRLKLNNSIGM